jgi:thioredoxin reductase
LDGGCILFGARRHAKPNNNRCTGTIDNYPGFDDGVDAVLLVQRLEKQASTIIVTTPFSR